MQVRVHFQHLVFIKTQETPLILPHHPAQSFMDAELIAILLCATPKKWQCKMDQIGIDPMEKYSTDLLRFMENCEAMEDFDSTSTTVAGKPNTAKNNDNKGNHPTDPKKQKWCDNHGWSNYITAEFNQNKPGFESGKMDNANPKAKAWGSKMNVKPWQHEPNDS
jgi:hypothetical protein